MRLILPTIIQNRRIFFLDLVKVQTTKSENFIIDISSQHDIVPLVTIDESRSLQSLIEGQKDRCIDELDFALSYTQDKIVLEVSDRASAMAPPPPPSEAKDWKTAQPESPAASPTPSAQSAQTPVQLPGATLLLRRAQGKIELYLTVSDAEKLLSTTRQLSVQVEHKVGGASYSGVLYLQLAPARSFVHTVLDFGSEASQVKHKYTRSSMGVETTEASQENLFLLLKNHQQKMHAAENYLQYSAGDNFLKSVFYIKHDIGDYDPMGENFFLNTDQDQLLMLCTRDDLTRADFNKNYLQLPNLKLAHRHGSNLSNLMFKYHYSGLERMVEFEHLKEQIYATLLREMSMAYLSNPLIATDGLYLRYSILIPNIYDHADLHKTKNIINRVLLEAQSDSSMPKIVSWEIQTISESDASFLGYYNSASNFTEPDKHYIVIDCGKGTTDFSILRTSATNSREVSPVYRNGFAGAGNLISYGYFQSMLHFLIQESINRTEAKNFYEQMVEKLSDNQRQTLFEIIEKWKYAYNGQFTEEEISASWRDMKDGDINITNLYTVDDDYNRVMEFLKRLRTCYDWGGHISDAVGYIANNISINIDTVINRLEDKSSSIQSVLFTGRAFLYPPLYDEVVKRIESIGISATKIEKLLSAEKLKSVCLDGVIQDGNIIHPEMIGIPIQVDLKTDEVDEEDDLGLMPSKTGVLESLKRMAIKFVDGGSFDSAKNELVVRTTNLRYSKFMMSNSFFSFAHPFFNDTAKYHEVDFIFTNSGFYFRAKDTQDTIIVTSKLGDAEEFTSIDKAHVVASLFPATIDAQIIEPFHQDFSALGADNFDDFLPKT